MNRSAATRACELGVLFLAALSACHSDTTAPAPSTPNAIVFDGTATPTGTVGQPITPVPTIEIHNSAGKAANGVAFTVTVVGGGTLTAVPASTGPGPTALGIWTLGTAIGTQALVVHAAGYADLMISAIVKAGPPTTAIATAPVLAAVSSGTMASGVRPSIKVTDQYGNPIQGLPVTVQLTGGGSVQAPSPVTDANGVAAVGAWSVGAALVPQTIAMSAASLPPVTFQFTSTGTFGANAYTVDIRFIGTPAPAVQAAFAAAAARVQQVITTKQSSISFANVDAGQCDSRLPVVNEVVPNLLVFAIVTPIDGVGGILASSGPCFTRSSTSLPVLGVMEFDSADLAALAANGEINPTVLHEMQHVLGYGTLWCTATDTDCPSPAFVLLSGKNTANPVYLGAAARAEYINAGGVTDASNGIPLEGGTLAGTSNVHWRYTTFVTELMTGYLTPGARPFSRISIASLADLGYPVSYATADAYAVSAPSSLQAPRAAEREPPGETLRRATFTIDDVTGRVTRLGMTFGANGGQPPLP